MALGRPGLLLPRYRVTARRSSGHCRRVPAAPTGPVPLEPGQAPPWADALAAGQPAVVRLPPATDLLDLVLSTLAQVHPGNGGGSVLVLVPSAGWASRLAARLARRGWPATTDWAEARAGWPVVVGSRAGAWAPVPRLAAAVVLDAHDAAYREESSPTYSAVDVVLERARRQGAPCLVVSPVPPVSVTAGAALTTVEPTVPQERAGWPGLERVDRRGADPRTGLFSEQLVRLAHQVLDGHGAGAEAAPFVCVYNRTGGARLLACAHCGELARCARCGAAAAKGRDSEVLACPRCGETRPVVCAHCGRLRMKTLRAGVSHLREELAALLGVEVGEVAGPKKGSVPDVPAAPVLVGTEAVLHRVRRAAAVAFLDIDLHLLAPRLVGHRGHPGTLRARRAARRRSGRCGACRPASWSRRGCRTTRSSPRSHSVSPHPSWPRRQRCAGSRPCRRSWRWPSSRGTGAGLCRVPPPGRRMKPVRSRSRRSATTAFSSRAPDHEALCDLLAAVPRPAGPGPAVEVDPVTV